MYSCDTLLANTTVECGFSGISRALCEARGCCFNDKLKYPHLHCFPATKVEEEKDRMWVIIVLSVLLFLCCCLACCRKDECDDDDR